MDSGHSGCYFTILWRQSLQDNLGQSLQLAEFRRAGRSEETRCRGAVQNLCEGTVIQTLCNKMCDNSNTEALTHHQYCVFYIMTSLR